MKSAPAPKPEKPAGRRGLGTHYLDPRVLQKLGPLEMIARHVVEGIRIGMHRSPLRGFSTEFAQHRAYVPGDELKHIDWKVYSRTNRYYVKLYRAEVNFTANLLVDASASMRYGSSGITKLEYAKYMAASLAYLIIEQRDSVGLGVFNDQLRTYVEPKGSMSVIHRIATELANTAPEAKTNISAILHEFARRIKMRGYVILFSDLFDDVESFVQGLNHLRFRGHNVVVFHLLDPYELDFPYSGTVRFRGLEGEGDVTTQPKRIRDFYMERLKKFLVDVRVACERINVGYLLVDTSKPVDVALTSYLVSNMIMAGAR